jgi:hypothetical protein
MIKKLKTFAMAMLLTGATVTATKADTLYQTLSVNLVLTFQETATTNAKTGVITDTAGKRSLTTAQFMTLLATNLGITLDKNATLVRVTTLTQGTNFTGVVTNSATLIKGNTTITTVELPTSIVWTNLTTNGPALVTTSGPEAPPLPTNADYVAISATNFTNYIIQGVAEPVILGSTVGYFIHNAANFNDTNFDDTSVWVPLNNTNNNAHINISAFDQAENFQNENVNNPFPIDDPNSLEIDGPTGDTNYYFGDTFSAPNVEFYMADLLTNLQANATGSGFGPIFVGTVKTDMAITGTLDNDFISISVGYPNQPIGTPSFLANMGFSGTADATATTGTVGKGKTALPFTSWNATFDVTGSGWLGGTDTNTSSTFTNYLYSTASNGIVAENPGFFVPDVGFSSPTNPPAVFTNSFVYASAPSANPPIMVESVNSFGFTPQLIFTNFPEINDVTSNYTVNDAGITTNIYTNIFTNIYTLTSTNTYIDTNLSIVNPTNQTFTITGTVKQAATKIGPP